MAKTKETTNPFAESVALLNQGINAFIQPIEKLPDTKELIEELRRSQAFLNQFQDWSNSLPPDRFRSALFSLVGTMDERILKTVQEGKLKPSDYGVTSEFPSAPFIMEAVTIVGPEIVVSNDKMQVTVTLPKEFKHVWTPERIKAGLERQGIAFGLSEEKIAKLVEAKPETPLKVAFGKKSVSGTDAVLEDCLGLEDVAGKPQVTKDDRVDFKELNLVRNISQGQVIIKKIPVIPAIPGMDVYGNPLPCKEAEDIPFPSLANTEVSEDGLALVSKVDGCAYWSDGQMKVVPTLEIKKNVDFSTGNISASVSVTVDGDILTGFKVESTHDVIVKGTAEGCRIIAKENLFLQGGLLGKEEADVRAGKNVDARYIDNAHVRAEGCIQVHGEILHSRLRARRIHTEGKDAVVIGGTLEAADDVCADILGCEVGTKTVIRLGCELEDIQNNITLANQECDTVRDRMKRYSEAVQSLLKIKESKGYLPPDKEKILDKLHKNIEKARETLEKKEEHLAQCHLDMDKAKQSVRMVRARQNIFPGVEIAMVGLDTVQAFETTTGPATVLFTGDTFEVLPYQDRKFEGEDEVE